MHQTDYLGNSENPKIRSLKFPKLMTHEYENEVLAHTQTVSNNPLLEKNSDCFLPEVIFKRLKHLSNFRFIDL